MRSRVPAVVLGAALAFGGLVVPAVVAPASAGVAVAPTRIMITGDSITEGISGDFTWRYRFSRELSRQHSNVDLVGPKVLPAGGRQLYLGTGWDPNHDAWNGTELHDQVGRIGQDVAGYQPDILISYLGTNDLTHVLNAAAQQPAPPSDADLHQQLVDRMNRMVDDWRLYINAARLTRPSVRFVLTELVSPRLPAWVRSTWNDQLLPEQVVGALSTPSSPIVVAAMDDPRWSRPGYLYDQVHPTPTGETIYAQRTAEAVDRVSGSVFASPIRIEQSGLHWHLPLAPTVKIVGGNRIYVYWYPDKTKFLPKAMRVHLVTIKTRTVRTKSGKKKVITTRTGRVTSLSSKPSWASAPMPPGRYIVSVQANRGTMYSDWSRTYAVRVPSS